MCLGAWCEAALSYQCSIDLYANKKMKGPCVPVFSWGLSCIVTGSEEDESVSSLHGNYSLMHFRTFTLTGPHGG